jgi:hypothetical protein
MFIGKSKSLAKHFVMVYCRLVERVEVKVAVMIAIAAVVAMFVLY